MRYGYEMATREGREQGMEALTFDVMERWMNRVNGAKSAREAAEARVALALIVKVRDRGALHVPANVRAACQAKPNALVARAEANRTDEGRRARLAEACASIGVPYHPRRGA